MIGFVVAFRPKCKSKNWEEDCLLLKNTLKSICNQTDSCFRVYVIYTDFPEIGYNRDKVCFVKFPFELMEQKELVENALLQDPGFDVTKNSKLELDYDKSKRIQYGSELAKAENCDFIMSVDADDLISNRIAAFVNSNKQEPYGWYVNKGYMRRWENPLLIKVNEAMVNINGSTNIVRSRFIPAADFKSKLVSEFSFFHWHAYLRHKILAEYEDTLKPLPFPAVIYVLHDSSLSGYNSFLKTQFLKTTVKYLVRGKWINTSIKKEFGLAEK